MNKKNKQIFFIIAGESSGDYHGSKLMHYMKNINTSIEFQGIGGSLMEAKGLRSLVPLKKLAVMGFWEVLKKLFFFLSLEKKILQHIKKTRPDKIVLIDYPGLNLRLSKKIKSKFNIPIIYYISPQVWAWKEKRVYTIKKYVDKLIVLFPFEKKWYERYQIPVKYFGHPLIYEAKQYQYRRPTKQKIYNIAFCPGSRADELKQHLPIFEQVMKQQKMIKTSINITIVKAANANSKSFHSLLQNYDNIKITEKPLLEALQKCDLAVISSGTATIECAATHIPMIVIYKMSWLSWIITKRFVKIQFAAMINVVANKSIVPELLQGQLTPDNIIAHLNLIINNIESNILNNNLENILGTLDGGNAHEQTSSYILNYEK